MSIKLSNIKRLFSRRVALLSLAVTGLTFAAVIGSRQAQAARGTTAEWDYYTDATYTTFVGMRFCGCNGGSPCSGAPGQSGFWIYTTTSCGSGTGIMESCQQTDFPWGSVHCTEFNGMEPPVKWPVSDLDH